MRMSHSVLLVVHQFIEKLLRKFATNGPQEEKMINKIKQFSLGLLGAAKENQYKIVSRETYH